MNAKKTKSDLATDSAILISEISRHPRGTFFSWDHLADIIAADKSAVKKRIQTVINHLRAEFDLVLENVHGEGYKLQTHAEVAEKTLAHDRERRRRSANKSKKKAATIDLTALTPQQQLKTLAEITAAHLTAETSTTESLATIQNKLENTQTPLALNKALDALKKLAT